MASSIYTDLVEFAIDEGWDSALSKAEDWRDTLQEMQEIASVSQRQSITNLLGSLELFFEEWTKQSKRTAWVERGSA